MKCPKCGYENREGAGFCGGCGQSFIAEKTCSQCGHANPQGNKFCDKCGHSLVEPAPETPSPCHHRVPRHENAALTGASAET